ncbi:taperin [Hyla sarda]|uniref:taperin n=1 Tax=Hyla sarda TaxID=327740 RepID=UPI0024C3BA57|nr:taperin [Hyla sarda]
MAVSGGGSTKSWSRLDPHSHKVPAWKLEVLERKRAKMASAAVPWGKDSSPNRRTRSPSRQRSPERLVLQDSLGPLHENPFIKQEKERRRHRRPQQRHPSPGRGASDIRHLLDMYSHVPGMRTIRAENIIIIESDPDYFSHSTSHSDPMEELLARRGSKVAEIRASEVIIYEPEVPNKDQPKKVLEPPKKVPVPPKKEELEHVEVLEEAGRVSRLLEKFDHGHSRPVRTRSLDNILEPDSKPIILPKPPILERQGQAPLNKSPPRRSGSLSPSAASILEEDSKRFPLNNPSWLPSKAPISPSLPDPNLFHKRPSSPMTSPVIVAPLSPSSPHSPRFEASTDDMPLLPTVATVREKFESGHTTNNVPPLPKLVNVTQKVSSNTILVNPKAVSTNKVKSPTTDGGRIEIDSPPLTNGHVDHLETNVNKGSSISIQDLLSKSKRPKGTTAQRAPKGNDPVPSNDPIEIPNGANNWRPKSEVDPLKSSSIPPKPSATYPDNPSITNHYDQAFTSATPSQRLKVSASTSSNDSFEIRPALKPDLSSIPDDDIQARALANIRMQSKNSFVFIPKRRPVPSVTQQDGTVQSNDKPKVNNRASTLNGPKLDSTDSPRKNVAWANDVRVTSSPQEVRVNGDTSSVKTAHSETLKASSVPSLSDFDWKSGLLPSHSPIEGQSFTDLGAELEYKSSVQQTDTEDVLSRVPVTKIHEDVVKADIPVTNIDDIVNIEDKEVNRGTLPEIKVEKPSYQPHSSASSIRNKGGNTFTVVPKRKPVTEQEAFRTPVVEEEEEDDPRSKRKSSDGPEAPYSELGVLLKKRYPTADEIQVIGGYQSLSKSCLTKIGSTRKKMKISFNEQNIHTMFEYPSENSLAEEAAEGEAHEVSGSESEEDDKPSGVFLPRPTFGSGGAAGNSLRANSANSGLSNYTPKHSVGYSKWQDEASLGGAATPDLSSPSQDMLTPADSNSHTDFRSEPALYF